MIDEPRFSDTAALRALAKVGVGALCTVLGIEGSYSRRLGAQLAVFDDGSISGSLADGCLEAQLVREVFEARTDGESKLKRFGRGSAMIDFQLPCGSGLDILIDPAPDIDAIRRTVDELDARRAVSLPIELPDTDSAFSRDYLPELRLVILGTGPEAEALSALSKTYGVVVETLRPRDGAGGELVFAETPALELDEWTAVVLLFHDHEWERALLPWALNSDAYYVGAQGGAVAREQRKAMLAELMPDADRIARLRAPVGLIAHARDPSVLALSILAEVVGDFPSVTG